MIDFEIQPKLNHEEGHERGHMIALVTSAVAILLVVGPMPIRQTLTAMPKDSSLICSYAVAGPIDAKRFQEVMQTVAKGWNNGDAKLAASCFTEDASYSAPPSRGHYGRKMLYEWFGGNTGRDLPMRMPWHHLLFDPAQQIGVGEYTFRYREQTHGLVIVKILNGLISNWREYEVASELSWEQFIGDNRF